MSDLKLQLIIEALNKTDKAFAELRDELRRATANIDQMAARSGAAGKAMGGHMHHATQKVGLFRSGVMNAAMQVMMLEMAVRQVARALDALVFRFNATLETAALGIATAFVSGGRYIDQTTGKALEGQAALAAAQEDSKRILEELQVANFQTIATLDQLVRAYQETLPVAMAKGFDRRQVKEFTVAMVQAAGAIGLSLDQLAEETRSMLTGTINPRTSRIATVLGLTNEDIRQNSANADQLFSFLMSKLEAYKAAGIESQKTWAGVWSNTVDLFNQISAKVSEPLFETVKAELQDIADSIVTIDAATGRIKWNDDFLEGMRSIKEGFTNVIAEMYRMGMLADTFGGGLAAFGSKIFGGDFGKWLEEQAQKYAERYDESDRKLQELANRAAGLNSDGTPKKSGPKARYQQRQAGGGAKTSWSESDLKKFAAAGKGVAGSWEYQARDKWEVRSRALQIKVEREQELERTNEEYKRQLWTESTANWEQQLKDREDVQQRHNAIIGQAYSELTQFGIQAARNIQDAFAEFLFNPFEEGLKGMLKSFGDMVRRMLAQIASSYLLRGLFSGMAGSSIGWVSTAGQTLLGSQAAPVHHGGGVFTPVFHGGGLNANEGFAILERGERVLSVEQNRIFERLAALLDGGGAARPVNVSILNQGEPVKASSVSARSSRQGLDIVVTLEKAMADRLRSRGGSLAQALEATYGLSRTGR